ncbi:MAG: presenilin family intramembrane aspartyl protease [Methanospirillum sp.]|nr:presenilin family intramembrane aspartyl protease [Methanospirillum sp.]
MRSKEQIREFFAILAMPVMLLAVEIGSVLLAVPMTASGYAVFEDPESLSNPIWFIVMLLGFTAFMLILIKYKFKHILNWIIRISLFIAYIYVFSGLLGLIISAELAFLLGTACAGAATLLLWKYPEWYVVDILGVLLAAGVASMFGISLEPVPVILLLILLAVYDAISVYKTKHMLTLADGVIEGRMPIMVVVPKKEGYSFIRDGVGGSINPDESKEKNQKHDRAAYLMGLGDLIMPSILVTSAAVFVPGGGIGMLGLPAIGAILGSLAGLGILLHAVHSGRPQAGLPPLNGGAILGFLIGWFMMTL